MIIGRYSKNTTSASKGISKPSDTNYPPQAESFYFQTFAIDLMLDQRDNILWRLSSFSDYQNWSSSSCKFLINKNRLTVTDTYNHNTIELPSKLFSFCSVNQVIVPSWQLGRALITMVLDAEGYIHQSRPTHRNQQLHRFQWRIADDDLS